MAEQREILKPQDARKTYRYLRLGMIGAVVVLAASIVVEHRKVDCWQTSISAYYYTPVRAIFVGSMMAVGLSLIVYKGRTAVEDISLNFAGMLAPLVAVAPTTDVGACWSVPPIPRPVTDDGSLAGWVVTNIENNVDALLIAGALGVIAAVVIAVVARLARPAALEWRRGTIISLAITAGVLLAVWWLSRNWDDFDTRAHGYAAVGMFALLTFAIVAKIFEQQRDRKPAYLWTYLVIAVLMILGGILIPVTRLFDDHTVFALETFEITFFAVYWSVQTVENWDEQVRPVAGDTPVNGCSSPPP